MFEELGRCSLLTSRLRRRILISAQLTMHGTRSHRFTVELSLDLTGSGSDGHVRSSAVAGTIRVG